MAADCGVLASTLAGNGPPCEDRSPEKPFALFINYNELNFVQGGTRTTEIIATPNPGAVLHKNRSHFFIRLLSVAEVPALHNRQHSRSKAWTLVHAFMYGIIDSQITERRLYYAGKQHLSRGIICKRQI